MKSQLLYQSWEKSDDYNNSKVQTYKMPAGSSDFFNWHKNYFVCIIED